MYAGGVVASGLTNRFNVGSFLRSSVLRPQWCAFWDTHGFDQWSTRGSCNRSRTLDKARAVAHCPAGCLSAYGVVGQGTNVVPSRSRALSRVTFLQLPPPRSEGPGPIGCRLCASLVRRQFCAVWGLASYPLRGGVAERVSLVCLHDSIGRSGIGPFGLWE